MLILINVQLPSKSMEKFVASIRRKYQERLIQCEEQWPPVRGDRLLNLQLVEAEKEEGFRAGLPQHGAANEIMFKRTPILYDNLFTTEIGKKPVRKIVVEGNAGMGKTTMCTMLAEGWAKDKILTQFDCVLVLPLRDRRVSSATSLSELFKLLHPSEKIHMAAIEYIEEREGKGVLIIADGWDEIEDCQSKHSFLYDLFFGGVLSFASVLLTSRPSASAPFHNYPSVDRLVEVVGFSEKNVKQYIQSEFEKFPEKASSLIEELENNPVIQSVCSVPLNCAIVCNLWHILDQSLPRTLTELYTKIVLSIIFRNVKKKFPERIIGLSLNSFDEIPDDLQHEFWLICEFAHECLLLDQLVFSEAELATRLPAVSKKFHCFGLLQSARSLLPVGHSLSFHFIHLTIQEFLAALHLVTLSNEKKLKVIENHSYMHNYRFDMMWKFMFGLGSNQTVASSSKKVIVFTIVVFDHFIQKKYVKNFLCHAAFEALHPLYATIVCNIYRSHLLFVSSSTLFDCVVYFHVLRHMKQCDRMGVAVFDCGLTDKVLKELTDILSEANGKLQVTSVDLGSNKLSSKGIADLFTRAFSSFSAIEILNIASNNITSMKSLMDISCSHLIHLDLSENPLGVTGLQSLEAAVQAAMLRNLSTLTLSNTLTDDTDINGALLATFLPSLASRCHKLRKLDLSGNNLCAQGLCTLAENIPIQLEMLFLRDTLIADVCPNESIDLQLQRCDPLRCLESVDLSGCNFNGRSLVIAKFMQSLEVLVCLDCSLISTDIVTLMSGLKMANVVCKSLIEWNLSNNDIDDEGVITLAENIPELFPSLKGFSTPNGVIIHGNPAGEELVYMCNSQLEVINVYAVLVLTIVHFNIGH